MGKEKIYVAYAKENNSYSLYAYSTDKEYFNNFIGGRNKDYFKIKSHNISELDLKLFMLKNHSFQIIKDNLYDGKDDITVYCTVEESNKLSESCDYIIRTVDFMSSHKHEVYDAECLPHEDLDLIINLTDKISKCIGIGTNSANINTLKLFYQLFKKTFDPSKE